MNKISNNNLYGRVFKNKTLLKIYESFNVKFFIDEKFSKNYEKDLKLLANRLLSNIKSKKELRDYEFCGVNVGQDIYEAYLIQGNPTINFNDNKLQNIFFKAILKVIFWENYLKYNFHTVGNYSESFAITEQKLGQLNLTVDLNTDLLTLVRDKYNKINNYF